MKYQFIHVEDKETLVKLHGFRYKVYEEMGWLNYSPVGEIGKEQDAYDDYSDHFVILDSNGEICCAMRLIHDSPIGYPTEEYFETSEVNQKFDKRKLGEMSRIFIGTKHRNMRETRIFINTIVKSLAYEKMKKYGIEYCYGLLEPSFMKLVNIFKIPYAPICNLKQVYNKLKYPSVVHVKDLEKSNPQLEELWKKHKKVSIFQLDTKIKPEEVII